MKKQTKPKQQEDRMDKLIKQIKIELKNWDKESGHFNIDKLIVEFINDPRLMKLWNKKSGWGYYS